MRLGPVVVFLVLALASPASAMTMTLEDGSLVPEPYRSWLAAAKAPLPTNEVTLHLGRCPGVPGAACALPGDIWIDPDMWDPNPRQTFLHEVGHQFDYSVMTDSARQSAQFIRNDPRPWRQGPDSSHERFAEAWMHCALWPRIRHRWNNIAYAYRPSLAVHRRMCRLILWTAAGYFD